MADPIEVIVGIFVAAILTGALIPVAITLVLGANTSTFDTATLALYSVIPIAIIVAVVVIFFAIALKVTKGKGL